MDLIVNDDARNLGSHVSPRSVDCIILDPPYGIGDTQLVSGTYKKTAESWDQFDSYEQQQEFAEEIIGPCLEALKDTGNLFVFGSYHSIYLWGYLLQRAGCHTVNSIVWQKENAMFSVTRTTLVESCEHIIWFGRTKSYYFDYEASKRIAFGKQLRNVWASAITPARQRKRFGHPHQKPLWLIERLLTIGCPTDGLVADPMCGSGTTAVAAYNQSRRALCLERDNFYCMNASNRLAEQRRGQLF